MVIATPSYPDRQTDSSAGGTPQLKPIIRFMALVLLEIPSDKNSHYCVPLGFSILLPDTLVFVTLFPDTGEQKHLAGTSAPEARHLTTGL